MFFIVVLGLGFFLGYKLRGAVEIYRQCKEVNYIEKVVERVMSDKEIRIVDFKKKKEEIAK